MNILLGLIKKPQNIILGILIIVIGYFIYDYQSLKSANNKYASRIAVEAQERALLSSRYDALSNRVERQEEALSAYLEGIERVRKENDNLGQQLNEVDDEKLRESLDTITPQFVLNSLRFIPGTRGNSGGKDSPDS